MFREAWVLWLAIPAALVTIAGYLLRGRACIAFPAVPTVRALRPSWRTYLRHLLLLLRLTVIALVFVALARPQMGVEQVVDVTSGVDIELILDMSGSMAAEDMDTTRTVRQAFVSVPGEERPNRLYYARKVAGEFISKRKSDRIGLIVFARYAYIQCPRTLDYGVLQQFLDMLKPMHPGLETDPVAQRAMAEENATAIGSAIALAVSTLKDSKAKSKVAILLTDGRNNVFDVDPDVAAEIARTYGVKLYTIGVGKKDGSALIPFRDPFGQIRYTMQPEDLDEDLLKRLAEKTNGKYFYAGDVATLRRVYAEIDQLEKSPEKRYLRYSELFQKYLVLALAVLCLELVLSSTYLRSLP